MRGKIGSGAVVSVEVGGDVVEKSALAVIHALHRHHITNQLAILPDFAVVDTDWGNIADIGASGDL